MSDSMAELLELYASWSDEEIVRRYRAGGLTGDAHNAMAMELVARGIEPASLEPAPSVEPMMAIHTLDAEMFSDADRAWLAARLEGAPAPNGKLYYVDPATLEVLASDGPDEHLVTTLREWLGDSEGIEVLVPAAPSGEEAEEHVHNPSRYRVTQTLLSPVRAFEIHDERGTLRFVVNKLPLVRSYALIDGEDGAALMRIKGHVLSLRPTYGLWRGEEELALMRLDTWGAVESEALVADWSCSYFNGEFRRGDELVAQLRGAQLDIARGEDEPLFLAAVVAIKVLRQELLRDRG